MVKNTFKALLYSILLCGLISPAQTPAPDPPAKDAAPLTVIRGQVVKVADGDTVTLLVVKGDEKKQYRIRFAGIDAPESKQAFGQVCKKNLSDKVFGKEVEAQFFKTDKYGRNVSKIVFEGRDINLEQVRDGCAWHYKKYADEQPKADQVSYAQAETDARAAKRGLWADSAPMNPSDYRNKVKLDRWGAPPPEDTPIIGNKDSKKYHLPGCPGYKAIKESNRVFFASEEEAEDEGYRMAGNCSYSESIAGLKKEGWQGDYPFSGGATTNNENHPTTENGTTPLAKEAKAKPPPSDAPPVVGNKESKIYHLKGCGGFNRALTSKNRVDFKTEDEAVKAGYRKAKNCQ